MAQLRRSGAIYESPSQSIRMMRRTGPDVTEVRCCCLSVAASSPACSSS